MPTYVLSMDALPALINMCAEEAIPALKVYPSMPIKVTFRAGTYSLLVKIALSFGRLSHAKYYIWNRKSRRLVV